MNEIQMQYKRETGNRAKTDYEAYYDYRFGRTSIEYDLSEFIDDGFIEIFNLEYVKWLEEKLEHYRNINK